MKCFGWPNLKVLAAPFLVVTFLVLIILCLLTLGAFKMECAGTIMDDLNDWLLS